MDGQALTFEDSTFDAAFSILSATLFPDWSAGLDEAVRVVRLGGCWGSYIGQTHMARISSASFYAH
jgi:ubiquinone/menaquinone biosynthesis C-methylase UbiE